MNSSGPQSSVTNFSELRSDVEDKKVHTVSQVMEEEKPVEKKPSLLGRILTCVLYYLDCAASVVLAVLVMPIMLLFLGLLNCGRWVFFTYIQRTTGCIPLEEDDAVWQQDVPKNRHIIHALMMLEGVPDFDKLKELVCARLVYKVDAHGERVCPRLTQVIKKCCGQLVWQEEENFKMDDHFTLWKGDFPKSKEELEDIISGIGPLPLSEKISPWNFYIIPTTYEKPSYAFLVRIHHSIGDGVGLTRVFVKNLYDVPPIGGEPRKFSTNQRMYMWCKAMVMGPMLVVKKILTRADVSVVHGPELSGQKTVSWSQDVSLALVKKVKNFTGTTVNDVMVSCIAGALHDYLKNHGLESPVDMWASVPVDIRASKEILKVTNKFALVFLRMPIVASGCVERLYQAKRRMDIIKASAEPLITATTVTMLMMLPGWFSRPIINFFSRKMSCVLSNIPGPLELLSIGGQKVYEGLFFPPMRANMGIGLSIFSYGGAMRIGLLADKNIIAKPREITQSFVKHFNMLVTSLQIELEKKID